MLRAGGGAHGGLGRHPPRHPQCPHPPNQEGDVIENIKGITISEATPADAEQLIALTKRIGGESDHLTYGPEGIGITLAQERSFLQGMHDSERSVFLWARRGDEPVGMVSLSAGSRRTSHRSELGISVVRAEWRHGIGSALLARAIAYAREHGTTIVTLSVHSDNLAAIRLYQKFGFRRIGTLPGAIRMPDGSYKDSELMYLDLR